jgi:para-aminobenzoate synthetase component 1
MRAFISFPIKQINLFADQLTRWSVNEKYSIILRSNDFSSSKNSKYQLLAAFGVDELICPTSNHFSELKIALNAKDWLFGFLSYDLKNEIEHLSSDNADGLNFPEMLFFRPSIVFSVENQTLTIHYNKNKFSKQAVGALYDAIIVIPPINTLKNSLTQITPRFTKEEYLATVNNVLKHIQRGDVYEMNLCQEFYLTNCKINPYETYIKLNNISPTPFSAFGRFNDRFLLCASPERYILKEGKRVISQPIKGTIARGLTTEDDYQLREKLRNDPKEQSENIMIVDLVRNDLSRVAEKASVIVDELCEIYPFKQVNQMISTISCNLDDKFDAIDLLKATFPMGSMTGAPKVSAMKLIEQYERSKRGLFSGAVGYIDPDQNLDFNVVIRTILYNKTRKYLSYTVGGAITNLSNPESEYNECLLKAEAINQVLKSN